jgi:VWFA-related protein
MRRLACLASALVVGALALHAQSPVPQQRTPTFRGGIDIVQMDVSVLDKDRRPVKGLTAADFTIVESDEPQPIVEFEEVNIADRGTVSAPWMRDAGLDVVSNDGATRRVVLIVMDDANIPVGRTRDVRRIARDVIDRLGPEDLAGVAFTDQGRRLDMTQDRSRLLKAIDDYAPQPPAKNEVSNLSCEFRGTFTSKFACVLDTLKTAGDALLNAPQGRKTLVYISAGVPFRFTADSTPESRFTDWADDLKNVAQVLTTLQRANVNVYGIDPSGITVDGVVIQDRVINARGGIMGPDKDSLRMFSEDTGGRATIFTNTPWEAVPQIFLENSSYYMLAFRRTHPENDGRFRKVQVKVNRRDVDVRTRSGYFAPADETVRATAPPVTPLNKAIGASVPGGDLTLAATVAPFAVAGTSRAALAIATLLRDPLPAGSHTIEIATLAVDPDCGDCRTFPASKQSDTFTIAAGATAAARAQALSRLNLAPGSYQIRVAATLGEQSGVVFAHVDVPDFQKDKLAASGLVLSAAGTVATAQRNIMASVLPIVPTALREFRQGEIVTTFLRLYQNGSKVPENVRVTAKILDASNTTRLDATTTIERAQFGAAKSADFRMNLQLATLEPGAYLLSIDAQAGKLAVKREARFWVR